jgi:hypothetical protein
MAAADLGLRLTLTAPDGGVRHFDPPEPEPIRPEPAEPAPPGDPLEPRQ